MRKVDPAGTAPGCQGEATDRAAMLDRDLYAAWLNLSRVYVSTRLELDRAIQRETGIGLAEGEILFRLVFAPGHRLRMSDLADRLGMAQSGITRVMDRLAEQGLAVRETRPSNRRTIDACLTAAGHEAFERARPVYMSVIRERFGRGLTARDAARLRASLRAVVECAGAREEVPWAHPAIPITRSE
jgi:DNA-binding MarR family transcriptional regulator